VLRLRHYERLSVQNRRFRSNGFNGWPKISGRSGRPHQLFFFSESRINDLSYSIQIWTDFSFVLSQCTRLTDGQTEFPSLDLVCIPCSAVKMHRLHLKLVQRPQHDLSNMTVVTFLTCLKFFTTNMAQLGSLAAIIDMQVNLYSTILSTVILYFNYSSLSPSVL